LAAKTSAGILLYRVRGGEAEVLLVHPGGPFWAKKDVGAWFVVKGELDPGEDALAAAKREFAEELGSELPDGELIPLGTVKHKAGKVVHAWAVEGDLDVTAIQSNTFTLEWPPKSGKMRQFPEIDQARFYRFAEGARVMHAAESEFLSRLRNVLVSRNIVCTLDDAFSKQ
jgi:predicted NUDIX family NTP pyrophosphohydrolase